MDKIYVVYWSQSGNTQAMAEAIGRGITAAGKEAVVQFVSEASIDDLKNASVYALGCPAMGAEELEDSEFLPMFESCTDSLNGKKIALFGSYGWGDGEWMRTWQQRVEAAGGVMIEDGLICNNAPDDDALAACRALGEKAAK